jgi:hypothetical protein
MFENKRCRVLLKNTKYDRRKITSAINKSNKNNDAEEMTSPHVAGLFCSVRKSKMLGTKK